MTLLSRHRSTLPNEWNGSCNALIGERKKEETQAFSFVGSRFVPVAIGFFGLGTGYFIWGGQALFGSARTRSEQNDGNVGYWMPGFMRFITRVYLLVGLTWFNVFGNAALLYMTGPAFTAYGIHWFAMTHHRYIDSSAQPDGWMAITFLVLKHSGSGPFPARGRYSRDDHLRRYV